ncbi:dihydrofolate reductase family protein [Gordonia polyisoprenivorans]|uniref:dihydrofolate reductase family protein n=1 Tax=Gordonia polyisoprenivorans TaxID=84595 RepID=UPI001AD64F06|nr:dihydrofolate reductase family protein [Gordonia polyisoprenivorans]QTI68058.1 dihydrofolate reductase family protein [Gordonia polyisoprenivorans]
MGKIHVHEFVSLDGRFEDPSFTAPYGFTDAMGATLGEIMSSSTAILLGHNTFDMFAPAWSTRTADDDPGAPFFNDTPKYVVSSTLTDAEAQETWRNSSALGPYSAQNVADLKERTDGSIYISGSGQLVRALLADGLVDELHLLVYPVVLGTGARLFDDLGDTRLRVVGHDVFDNGVVHLSYGPEAQ